MVFRFLRTFNYWIVPISILLGGTGVGHRAYRSGRVGAATRAPPLTEVSELVSECGPSQFLTFPHMMKSADRANLAKR